MSKIKAKDVILTVGGKKVAGATDAGLSLTTVFATSQTKEDKREKSVPERVDWTTDSSSIIGEEVTDSTTILELRNAAKNGTKLGIEFSIGSIAKYTGEVMITSYTETAPVEGRPTCAASFKGVSALTKYEPEPEEPETPENPEV